MNLVGALGTLVMRAEPLLVCGGPEVFVVDSATATNGAIPILWRWRASERTDLPEPLRDRFGNTDECKPAEGGRQVLIYSSGGGCALVERPAGRVLWHARVTNPHSLEKLPGNRVIAASAKGGGWR